MKLFALVALTMCAFAANSVLNRIGVALQGMEPLDFATVRTTAGAAVLWLLISLRKAPRPPVLPPNALQVRLHLQSTWLGFRELTFRWMQG